MFEVLFQRPHALRRHVNGPLAEERRRYLCHLAHKGMGHGGVRTIAHYLLASVRFLRLAKRPGEVIHYAEVEEKAAQWAKRPPKARRMKRRRYSRAQFLRYASSWLQFLGRLERPTAPPSRFADQIAAFANYLSRDKGLAFRTVEDRCKAVRLFLDRLVPTNNTLHDISILQIDRALIEQVATGGYARITVRGLASDLRSFFRFGAANRWCPSGLAAGIKSPRVFAHETLPLGPSWDDVRRLLATAEGDRPTDIRDRALLLLLAVYGLRACEVRCLRLEDFDWRQERLLVRRTKTDSVQIYPLSRSVAAAVLRYLREVRPASAYREVFLIRYYPFSPFGTDAIGQIVRRRFQALKLALPHYGSHALRHACATHLLAQGLSLKEIGDHLGHRDPDSTRIYAKVDLAGLREVADFELGDLL